MDYQYQFFLENRWNAGYFCVGGNQNKTVKKIKNKFVWTN